MAAATTAGWGLAFSYAKRELRAGLSGFRVFLACLTLGVAAIAAVGTVSEAFLQGLRSDGRAMLGGDVSLRLTHRAATDQQLAYLNRASEALSTTIEMRAMARPLDPDARRSLVELKAVEPTYPLVGELRLADGAALHDKLALVDGVYGAVVDGGLVERLKISLGDRVKLGTATIEVRGVIEREPDRVASVFAFGPRMMIAADALPQTGLIQPGSQTRYYHRAVLQNEGAVQDLLSDLNREFPEAGWRIQTSENAAPGVRRFIDRLTLFLSFVGLTVLLVGGIGVTNAVKSYLDSRTGTIATLKCLGATGSFVFRVYLIQILALALVATVLGLAIGISLPSVGLGLLGDRLPVIPRAGVYPTVLATAAGFGILTALTFALWPLAQSRGVKPQALFRTRLDTGAGGMPKGWDLVGLGVGAALLGLLAVLTATEPRFAAFYVISAMISLGLLRGAAWAVMRLAGRIKNPPSALWRLVLANMTRPGSSVPSVVLSLGLGLSALVSVGLIEANMARQVSERLPANAPAFFFLDIQNDQVAEFDRIVSGVEGTSGLKRVPSLRGRITAINGVAADLVDVHPDSRWALRGDRGLTYTAALPDDTNLVDGEWWPEDYSGPPLISFDARVAEGFGVGVGDTLTLNILGRDITAEIASLREIDWRSLRFDFAIVFAPGTLEGAPQTHIAAIEAPEAKEETIERQVADAFANVSAIRVREALAQAANLLAGIGWTVTGTALVTILAGALVLAGTIAASHRKRVYDAVVLKVLGATRGRVAKAFLMEYGVLGLVTAAIGGLVGTASAYAVVTYLMRSDWAFDEAVMARTVLVCLGVTLILGFFGTWRALGEKAAPHLRND